MENEFRREVFVLKPTSKEEKEKQKIKEKLKEYETSI